MIDHDEPTGPKWKQVGTDIDGEASGDSSGSSVAMSADGKRIAVGAGSNDGNGSDAFWGTAAQNRKQP